MYSPNKKKVSKRCMGEVPKIEWQPREEARDEVQKRLSDGLE